MLYHRWQVDGRKEAPLPFMIANKLDGAGSSFYTMGDRKYPGGRKPLYKQDVGVRELFQRGLQRRIPNAGDLTKKIVGEIAPNDRSDLGNLAC